MSKPARATAIAEWGKEKARRDEIRGRNSLPEEIPPANVQKYYCDMEDFLEKYQRKAPPAMPCVSVEESDAKATQNDSDRITNGCALIGEGKTSERQHQER